MDSVVFTPPRTLENWYALAICVLTGKNSDDALMAMNIKPRQIRKKRAASTAMLTAQKVNSSPTL